MPNVTTAERAAEPRVGEARPMRRVRRPLALLGWGSLIAPVLLLAAFAAASWDRLQQDARQEAARRAELIVEYVRRTIEGQELLLAAADQAHGRLSFGPDLEIRMHLFLAALTGASGWDGVSFVSPEGAYLVSSEGYPATGAFADAAYVAQIPREGVFADRTRIGAAQLLIVALRDRSEPESGVWVAQIAVSPIEAFLRNMVGEAGEDAASVMRRDGRLLLRSAPMPEPVVLGPETAAMRGIARADVASYETRSAVDGVRRIYSTRKIGRLPLYASFGVSIDRLRAEWLRQVLVAGALLGSFGAIGYGVARHAGRALDAEATRSAHDFDRKLLAEAQKTAAARETMLRELNHRINNNLQMIQSLIRLQKTREAGPDLDEIAARILAIARIHDLLYQSGASFSVDLAALLQSVATNSALVPPERDIAVDCDLERVEADARTATPLALCVTELITNAVKHAFGPEGGAIRVTLRKLEGGAAAEVVVADDGRGLGEAKARRSGSRLIEALAVQIGGSLDARPARPGSDRPGVLTRIVFPLDRAEA